MQDNNSDEPYIHVARTPDGIIPDGCLAWHTSKSYTDIHPEIATDVFAEWRWDGNSLEARNCRYGFYPLYYYADEKECILSTSISKLLAIGAPASINYAALAILLRLGFHVGEDTILQNIFVLPPNGRLRWSNGEISVTGGFILKPENSYTRSAAIDNYIDLFRQSIRRRLLTTGSYSLPLSGGRDSRHILYELDQQGSKPSFCVTTHEFPPSNMEDIRIAKILCERFSIPFTPITQTASRLRAELRKNILTDFGALEHAWAVVLTDFLKDRTSAVYDGIGGDVLSAGLYLNPKYLELYSAGRYSELALLLLSGRESYKGYENALQHITAPGIYQRINLESAVEDLSNELARHADAPSPLSSFFFWNRTRRCISLYNYGLLPKSTHIITPYLDHDLYDFLASLPVDLLTDKMFHNKTIEKAYPQHADLPYENKSCPKFSSHWHTRRLAIEAAFYMHRNPGGQLVNHSFITPRLLRYTFVSRPVIKNWLAPVAAIYLCQLENILDKT